MKDIAIDPEEIRYYKGMMMDMTMDLSLINKQLGHLLKIMPEITDDKEVIGYVNRINVECIKQHLFTTLIDDSALVLYDIARNYEEVESKVNTIINQ